MKKSHLNLGKKLKKVLTSSLVFSALFASYGTFSATMKCPGAPIGSLVYDNEQSYLVVDKILFQN